MENASVVIPPIRELTGPGGGGEGEKKAGGGGGERGGGGGGTIKTQCDVGQKSGTP